MSELYIDGKQVLGGYIQKTITIIPSTGVTGNIYYTVKNGWCIVCFNEVKVPNTNTVVISLGELPPNLTWVHKTMDYGNNGTATVYINNIDGHGRITLNGNVTGTNIYGYIVYPVDDSWIPPQ